MIEKKKLGKKRVLKIKISKLLKASVSIRHQGGLEIESPDQIEPLLLSCDQRDKLIGLIVLYCHGFSLLKRMTPQ